MNIELLSNIDFKTWLLSLDPSAKEVFASDTKSLLAKVWNLFQANTQIHLLESTPIRFNPAKLQDFLIKQTGTEVFVQSLNEQELINIFQEMYIHQKTPSEAIPPTVAKDLPPADSTQNLPTSNSEVKETTHAAAGAFLIAEIAPTTAPKVASIKERAYHLTIPKTSGHYMAIDILKYLDLHHKQLIEDIRKAPSKSQARAASRTLLAKIIGSAVVDRRYREVTNAFKGQMELLSEKLPNRQHYLDIVYMLIEKGKK
jgi:hypothetical protein